MITRLLAAKSADSGLERRRWNCCPTLQGAFSLVFCDEHTLYAARDPHGVRPLVLGRLDRGWVIASETAALDIVGASFVREVEPGELLAIDADGLRSEHFAPPTPKGCVFEYVYLARPDTTISGRGVQATRVEIGRRLAAEARSRRTWSSPPRSPGRPLRSAIAQASGIPYGQGLVKNAYVGRTFIQPSQTIRQLGIRLKLNPLRDVIRGKRLVVVDDSIVRGNTQRALVRMLREAGALEVHVRIASPPVRWPCFYGIDFASRAELIANAGDVEAVRRSIGADTLGYVSLEALVVLHRAAAEPAVHGLLHRRLSDPDPGPDRQTRARGHRPRCRQPGARQRAVGVGSGAAQPAGGTPGRAGDRPGDGRRIRRRGRADQTMRRDSA